MSQISYSPTVVPHPNVSAGSRQNLHTRVAGLDVLRGIAACAVVVSHALPLLAPAAGMMIAPFFDLGSFGVFLFFLCSGTIMPATLERHQSLRRFWIRRVFRLYPLYWLSIAGAAICYAMGRTSLAGLDTLAARIAEQPLTTTLLNLTMFQEFLGYPHLINVYWTLSFELIFYILMSALFRIKLMHRLHLFAFGLLALVYTLYLLALLKLVHLPNPLALRNVSYLALLFVAAALTQVRHTAYPRAVMYALVGLTLGTVGLMTWLMPSSGYAWLAAFGVFGLAQWQTARQFPGWLTYLGTISYSLYLLHPLVFVLVPTLESALLTAILWIAALLCCATITERWIERPGINVGYYLTRPTSRAAV